MTRTETLDALIIGAGFSGMYELHLLRDRLGLSVQVFEAGEGAGRNLVLERIARGALRSRKPFLLLHILARAPAGMGLVRAVTRAAGNHALCEPCGGAHGATAEHPVWHARDIGVVGRGGQSPACDHRERRCLHCNLADHRGRLPVLCQCAKDPAIGELRRRLVTMADCIAHLRAHGIGRIEAKSADVWVAEVNRAADATLLLQASSSWHLGANVPGKPRVFMPYAGGMAHYAQLRTDSTEKGFEGFTLTARQRHLGHSA